MGIFSNRKNKNKLIAIFDIGSGSMGGALISLSQEKNPTILGQIRTDMRYESDLDFDKFSTAMNNALYDTAHKLMMLKLGRPEKIYCFLGSPWYVSLTRTMHVEEQGKFLTSKKMIDKLLQSELKDVIAQYEKKYEKQDTPKLIENVVLESLINGYKVNDIFDKKAKTLDMIVYLSMSPENVLSSIKDKIKKVYPHTDVHFGSFMMSFYNSIRLKYPKLDSYLLIDVNAEITDVGMVHDGILTSFFSFPIGRNYIMKKIMKAKNISKEQAESIFRLYVSGSLEEDKKNDMDKVLGEVESSWKNIFYSSIVDISKISGYTDIVHIVSHEDTSLYFSNILKNPNVPLKILGDRKFSVFIMEKNDLKNLCNVASGPCDQFLMSEALCLAHVYKL